MQAASLGICAFLLALFLCSASKIEGKILTLTGLWTFFWLPRPMIWILQRLLAHRGVVFLFPGAFARDADDDKADARPLLALTIDDGPAWEFDQRPAAKCSTSEIIHVLDRFDVKATWFIIGSHVVGDRKPLLEHLVCSGHELANHGMVDRPAWLLKAKDFEGDVMAAQDVIHDCGSGQRRWYRPGQGVFTCRMLRFLRANGFRVALGSIFPHDAVDLPPWQWPFPRLLAWLLVTKAQAGDVLILHDRPWTARTLELALPSLTARFEIGTLSRLADASESPHDARDWCEPRACEPREVPLLPLKEEDVSEHTSLHARF